MSSRIVRLKGELDVKLHELREQNVTAQTIEKLTRELEAEKKVLVEKSVELKNRQNEVTTMQNRLEALTTVESMQNRLKTLVAVESIIDNAMHTKSATEDVVNQVMERAIRSDHMSGSEIVKTVLNTAIHVNGNTRDNILYDFLFDLIDDEDGLKTAISSIIGSFGVDEVLKHTLITAMKNSWSPTTLNESLDKAVDTILGKKANSVEASEPTEGWYHNDLSNPLLVLKLTQQCAAAPKENIPRRRQPRVSLVNINSLRG